MSHTAQESSRRSSLSSQLDGTNIGRLDVLSSYDESQFTRAPIRGLTLPEMCLHGMIPDHLSPRVPVGVRPYSPVRFRNATHRTSEVTSAEDLAGPFNAFSNSNYSSAASRAFLFYTISDHLEVVEHILYL